MILGRRLHMAQQTTNYNLNKIEETDEVRDSIEHLNQNADSIDFELKRLNIQVLDNLQEEVVYTSDIVNGEIYLLGENNYLVKFCCFLNSFFSIPFHNFIPNDILTHLILKINKIILTLIMDRKIFFQDNDVGDIFYNFLKEYTK